MMINKTPTGWTIDLEEMLGPEIGGEPLVHDREPSRQSSVLGPDGNPVSVPIPRQKMGFDLSAKKDQS